jgi:hypothetical protein
MNLMRKHIFLEKLWTCPDWNEPSLGMTLLRLHLFLPGGERYDRFALW